MGTYAKAQGPIDLFTVTFAAGGTGIAENMLVELGTNQYEVVKCNNANSAKVIGVCTKTGVATIDAGDPVPVRVAGIVTVIAEDGNIAFGDFLKSGTTTKHQVLKVATGIGNGQQNIVGRALASSNAAGDSITMLLLTIPGTIIS